MSIIFIVNLEILVVWYVLQRNICIYQTEIDQDYISYKIEEYIFWLNTMYIKEVSEYWESRLHLTSPEKLSEK